MDYLNQISGATNPQPQQKQSIGGLFSKKFIFIISGLVIFAILIMILGSVLGKTGNKEKAVAERINIRISNLMTITQNYGKITKSSTLRSMNASLYSVLNGTSVNLSPLLTSVYSLTPETADAEIAAEEESSIKELSATLDHAKINGLLDRVYPREITLQISLLLSLELEASERTKDQNVKNLIGESYNNLSNLYTKFSEYSEAANGTRSSNN